MTLTDLRYATVLAKTKHFGLAAEQCNVSQPTLSIAIKKLESELGANIFERTATDVFVTRTGKKLLHSATKYLLKLQSLETSLLLKKINYVRPFELVLFSQSVLICFLTLFRPFKKMHQICH